MCSYTTFAAKVDLCAHTDSKNGTFTRRVLTAYIFDSYTPSPFCAGWRWGLLSRKIFLIFIFLIFARNLRSLDWKYFFIFSDFVIVLVWFWLSDYRFIISIFNLLILTRFGYAWLSFSTCCKFCSIFTRLRFSYSLLNFYSHQFRLVSALSILCFNSSTLYLFCLL